MIYRRRFVLQSSAVATVAALPASLGVCSPFRMREVSLDGLGFSTFARLVGAQFYVYPGRTPVKLDLVEVSAGRDHVPRQREVRKFEPEEFSLIFRGAKDLLLQQDTYPVAQEQIGRFVVFIGPVWAPDAVTGSRYYQAIFNRPKGVTIQLL